MQHKFKVEDRVVIVGGWLYGEYGMCVAGTFAEDDSVILNEPTKCSWEYKRVWTSGDYDLISEELYNSPLYQALK